MFKLENIEIQILKIQKNKHFSTTYIWVGSTNFLVATSFAQIILKLSYNMFYIPTLFFDKFNATTYAFWMPFLALFIYTFSNAQEEKLLFTKKTCCKWHFLITKIGYNQ